MTEHVRDTTQLYKSGDYLAETVTWHSEDSAWKAGQIASLMEDNSLVPERVAEIGCGAGGILKSLSTRQELGDTLFDGYDISSDAIGLARQSPVQRVSFFESDLLRQSGLETYDLVLVVDVFEHVPDYMEFLRGCQAAARYKIYHIPLDLHVSSVMRNSFIRNRYTVGHLHYFTADAALAALRDTGHRIIDSRYTNQAFGLFRQHPSFGTAIANIPRWLLSRFSEPLAARLLGGYSLLVLAE